jgi:hypothetical protein
VLSKLLGNKRSQEEVIEQREADRSSFSSKDSRMVKNSHRKSLPLLMSLERESERRTSLSNQSKVAKLLQARHQPRVHLLPRMIKVKLEPKVFLNQMLKRMRINTRESFLNLINTLTMRLRNSSCISRVTVSST